MNSIDDKMIQRYLDEEMTDIERMEFEVKLSQSETLQQQVAAYYTITEGIQRYGEEADWLKVQQLEAEAAAIQSLEQPNTSKWLFRSAAASLLLLMVAFPLYWLQDEQRLARLFNENFVPYQALGGATRGESNDGFVLPEAFEAYYEKDYSQAIELFRQASTQEDRPYVWLYLGNAYLSNKQPEEAADALQQVLTYADIDRKTELRTHWDLGLAYLKLNNKEAATRHFEILEDTEDYGSRAKKILKSIY